MSTSTTPSLKSSTTPASAPATASGSATAPESEWYPLVLRALRPQLDTILARLERDLQVDGEALGRFEPEVFAQIKREAKERLRAKLQAAPPMTSSALDEAWASVVGDFKENSFWGYTPTLPARDRAEFTAPGEDSKPPAKRDPRLDRYLKTFLVPTLITKAFILYFGLNYSMYPDEGYGYGLIISIAVTLGSFAYFVYLNWDSATE